MSRHNTRELARRTMRRTGAGDNPRRNPPVVQYWTNGHLIDTTAINNIGYSTANEVYMQPLNLQAAISCRHAEVIASSNAGTAITARLYRFVRREGESYVLKAVTPLVQGAVTFSGATLQGCKFDFLSHYTLNPFLDNYFLGVSLSATTNSYIGKIGENIGSSATGPYARSIATGATSFKDNLSFKANTTSDRAEPLLVTLLSGQGKDLFD